ncbi:hypothetical protein PV05_11516 [Exophiala xenobiotica]|uniref:GPI mannosyltransferase 2 n=1 Tax=Exophiala xenobiotica TaxID=348802 RepID=A0A0D2E313_9EURO|nr:uncharacterized protein PV05_11516 [Exophiala xenobiotica]KIW49878.1 hypothetical protein PV05_11516 [Exophiala xenobiotica]
MMKTKTLLQYGHEHPIVSLSTIFVVWKSVIFLTALASPGVGYDTCASLLWFDKNATAPFQNTPVQLQSQWLKFVRWDAIYFTHMAEYGHVYEQEWAFGIGLSSTISWIAKLLEGSSIVSRSTSFALAGILLSHAAHWLAVIQLWAIATTLGGKGQSQSAIPFVAATLHVFSPAGIFLSAPYTESVFACLSFSGFLAFLWAHQYFNHARPFAGCFNMVIAGSAFGLATLIRSNGILAGIPFLIEAVTTLLALLSQGFSLTRIVRLGSVGLGGILVAVGMFLPQVLAFQVYCAGRSPGDRREWCQWTLPSIFTFVQSHYWNVGPFRYWTLSNLPLFLLAAPTLWLLVQSASDTLRNPEVLRGKVAASPSASDRASIHPKLVTASLALPQLVLSVLALTSYHVQIIARISSGYPLWYIWLAASARDRPKCASVIIRWMILYALIQAGLYASFLPPA